MTTPIGRFTGFFVRWVHYPPPGSLTKQRIAEIREKLEKEAANQQKTPTNVQVSIHDIYPDTLTEEELSKVLKRNDEISHLFDKLFKKT